MGNPKRPKDTNQLAKLIADIATSDAPGRKNLVNGHGFESKNPGQQLGGLKGGKARAEKLTPEERKEIAQKAAKKRWNK